MSRKPDSNDAPVAQGNIWGSQNPCVDDTAILLSDAGKRCVACRRVVLNCHLIAVGGKNYCPDHAPKDDLERCVKCNNKFTQLSPHCAGRMCQLCWAKFH